MGPREFCQIEPQILSIFPTPAKIHYIVSCVSKKTRLTFQRHQKKTLKWEIRTDYQKKRNVIF